MGVPEIISQTKQRSSVRWLYPRSIHNNIAIFSSWVIPEINTQQTMIFSSWAIPEINIQQFMGYSRNQ
ncbi:uncharacterized protein DS421_18g621480 [Arachis hypogaea]|nr:uncharacterized protein DS421_18g621480 [Arachis hypogaea]